MLTWWQCGKTIVPQKYHWSIGYEINAGFSRVWDLTSLACSDMNPLHLSETHLKHWERKTLIPLISRPLKKKKVISVFQNKTKAHLEFIWLQSIMQMLQSSLSMHWKDIRQTSVKQNTELWTKNNYLFIPYIVFKKGWPRIICSNLF